MEPRKVTSPTVSNQLEWKQLPWLVKVTARAWNPSTALTGNCCRRFLLDVLRVGTITMGAAAPPATLFADILSAVAARFFCFTVP